MPVVAECFDHVGESETRDVDRQGLVEPQR